MMGVGGSDRVASLLFSSLLFPPSTQHNNFAKREHQAVDGPLDVRFEALAPGATNTLATRQGQVELLMVSVD